MVDFKKFCCIGKRRRVVTEFALKLYKISRSDMFCAAEVTDKNIHLCEAFALLWQDWFTGDVNGLWTKTCLLAAIYSCMLIELIALGKITFRKRRGANIYIEIIDPEITKTFLDKAVFHELLELDMKSEEARLVTRLSKSVKWRFFTRKNYATKTLSNLKKRKVLRQSSECFGTRRLYPTVNLEPHGRLEKEIRKIALNSKTPDCYMRLLLTFSHMADGYLSKSNKLLKRYFTKNEYIDAMERIDKVTKDWNPAS